MNLAKIENNDGLEFHIDTKTSLAYASVSASARMLGVNESTVRRNPTIVQAALTGVKTARTVDQKGGKQSVLLSSDQVFELAFKYNIELAKQMGAAGANVFMLGLAGYKVQVAPEIKIPTKKELAYMVIELETALEAAQDKIEADAPKVALAELIEVFPESISLSNYTKSIERGRTTFYKQLRTMGILQATGAVQPYQKHIDAGYFSMTMSLYAPVPVTYVTPKGKTWLAKRLADFESKQSVLVQMEREVEFAS
jgi:phage antirepressor YoqD-like protein